MNIKIVIKHDTTKDKARKRLLAAVCQYLEAMNVHEFICKNRPERMAYAKGVVERAARVNPGCINRISEARLKSLMYQFNKMRKDMVAVTDETYRLLEGTSGNVQNTKSEIIGLN